jgi:hypothetical protein
VAEGLPTLLTCVGSLPHVRLPVYAEGQREAVGPLTLPTLLEFGTTVCFDMSPEVNGTAEGFPTLLTHMGLLTSVCPHMGSQG